MNNSLVIPADDLAAYGLMCDKMGLVCISEITTRDWRMAFDYLTAAYKHVERAETWIQFALGDLMLLGENKFGEQIFDFIDPNDYAFETLLNFKTVAKNVPLSRRNENLTYKHHSAVSAVSGHEQTEWLDKAEQEHLSANALYEQVKASRGIAPRGVHSVTCPECGAIFMP